MLDNIFLQIFNMSITAAMVIAFVLMARLALKKVPKMFSYVLWSVVLFRLVCPFSFESIYSLLPTKANPISQDIVYMQTPKVDTGVAVINDAVNAILPSPAASASVNPLQIWLFIGSVAWVLGVFIMLAHSVIALIKLCNRLKNATYYSENIFLSSKISTAFVMGFIHPRIYLPINLSHAQREYILLHERTHIKRGDHIVKLISFLTLCVHWFNPLVWIAFYASGKDMEMACDESVIKHLGNDVKKAYSASLLTLATGKRIIGGTPLAFGEGDTKNRIKNVLSYKKPAFWVIIVAVIAIIALILGLMSSPSKAPNDVKITQDSTSVSITFPAYDQRTEYNDKIMDIKPFTLLMQLPPGWSVELRGDGDIKYPLMGAWTPLGIFNDKNEYIGAVGYNTYEESEGAQDVPQAIYNQIALGNNYQFDAQIKADTPGGAYDTVTKNEQGETAITTVYTSASISKELGYNGEEIINKGILAYNKDMLVYIAIELDEKKVSNEDLLAIAKSISINSHEQTGEKLIPDKLEKVIHTAIIEQNKSKDSQAHVVVESHVIFASEAKSPAENSNIIEAVAVYALVLYEEYIIVDGKIDAQAPTIGSYIPTAITFNVDANGDYTLEEYWLPRDGSDYAADIESKFPDEAQQKALNDPAYFTALQQDIYTQLIVGGHLNARLMIESLIEDISKMEGDRQSNWRLNAALDELIYYGNYMLDYSFNEFLKGNQSGKNADIMYNAIRDILKKANEDVSFGIKTGQAWFDSYLAHIGSYEAKEGLGWVEKNMPKAYILLSIKAENDRKNAYIPVLTLDISQEPPGFEKERAPDFLNAEQQVVYKKAMKLQSPLLMESTDIILYYPYAKGQVVEETSSEPIEINKRQYYWIAGRYQKWDDLYAVMTSIFTEDYFNERFGERFISDELGNSIVMSASRGTIRESLGQDKDTYELVSSSENEIVFNVIGHYKADGEGDDKLYTKSFTNKMELTKHGWRISLLNVSI